MESVITKVNGFTKSVQLLETLRAWRRYSTLCLISLIVFQSFANGKNVSYKIAASEINKGSILYAEGFKSVFLCILLTLEIIA